MCQLRVFISYSSNDSALAGLFKKYFEKYSGFFVFLAHEDISPATKWETRIIKELKISDLVVPLITDNYHKSDYTDQELGMALAWGKIILPVKTSNINPYGFISKFQALKCRDNHYGVMKGVVALTSALIESKEFKKYRNIVINLLFEKLSKSTNTTTSNRILRMLKNVQNLNEEQLSIINKIITHNHTNIFRNHH